jgi:hypothetical protein
VTFVAASPPDADPRASLDGVPVPVAVTRAGTRTSVSIADVPAGSTLVVALGPGPRLVDTGVHARLVALLGPAQIEYRTKTEVLRVATSRQPLHVRLAHLHALGLDAALMGAVDEILLARASATS